MFGKKKPKSDNKQMERKIEHKTGGREMQRPKLDFMSS